MAENTAKMSDSEGAALPELCDAFESYFLSDDSVCLLTSDVSSEALSAANTFLLSQVTQASTLSLVGGQQLTPDVFVQAICDHCQLTLVAEEEGCRRQLQLLCEQLSDHDRHYFLVIEKADELPIAMQAVLAHLINIQCDTGRRVKLLLLGRPVLAAQFRVFFPNGIRLIDLSSDSYFYTAWTIREILDRQNALRDFPPSDILHIIHDYADGDKEKIHFVLNKWQTARETIRLTQAETDLKQPVEKKHHQPISRIRGSFWNHQRMGSGMMMLALSVGIAFHGLRDAPPQLFVHHQKLPTYSVSLPDMSRKSAMQWVAAHAALPSEELVVASSTGAQAHYHIEFGAYPSREDARQAWQRVSHSEGMSVQVIRHTAFS